MTHYSPVIPTVSDGPVCRTHPKTARNLDLTDVARIIGITDKSTDTIILYVRDMIDCHGFPAPVNPRRWRGRLIWNEAASVGRGSLWTPDIVADWVRLRTASTPVRPMPANDRNTGDAA